MSSPTLTATPSKQASTCGAARPPRKEPRARPARSEGPLAFGPLAFGRSAFGSPATGSFGYRALGAPTSRRSALRHQPAKSSAGAGRAQ